MRGCTGGEGICGGWCDGTCLQPTHDQHLTINEWNEFAKGISKFKALERALRDELVFELFDRAIDSGSESIELGNGYSLKATKALNYSLSGELEQVITLCAVLSDEDSKRLIRWKPELVVSEYLKSTPDVQEMFNGILTIKPAAPVLEVVLPEAKK